MIRDDAVEVVGAWLEEILGGVVAVLEGIAEVPTRKARAVVIPTGSAVGAFLRVHVDGVAVLSSKGRH